VRLAGPGASWSADASVADRFAAGRPVGRARDDLVAAAGHGTGNWFRVVQVDAVLNDADVAARHLELAIDRHEGGVQNCAAVPRLAATSAWPRRFDGSICLSDRPNGYGRQPTRGNVRNSCAAGRFRRAICTLTICSDQLVF
jgi:hypothetical protein